MIPTDDNTFLIGPVREQQTNKAKRPMILDHSDQNIPKAKWEGIFFSLVGSIPIGLVGPGGVSLKKNFFFEVLSSLIS